MTPYSELFKLALRKITDPSLAQWPEEDLSNELYGWLESAIAKLPHLSAETAERDEFDPSNAQGLGFKTTLSDITKELIALGMTREWLGPQIKSVTVTLQRYSKKEGYSQKEHLAGLIALDNEIKVEMKKLFCDDTYVDSDYFD